MRIRNKLILAMAVPVGLLLLQIVLVNLSIRELQTAIEFISDANRVIEDDFLAQEKIEELRAEIKEIPARFVSTQPEHESTSRTIRQHWSELDNRLDVIGRSSAYASASADIRSALESSREKAAVELERTLSILFTDDADLDTLLETAIFAERGLISLKSALGQLVNELRRQLEEAVEYERQIHNRPIIAGIVVGGLVVLLIIAFAWIYVDGHLVARLTALSSSMLAIAGGNLRAEIPDSRSDDEIGEMAEALAVFRDTAAEVEEKNLREVADARQRLIDAIESMSEGFSLYDSKDRLVICNRRYGELLCLGMQTTIEPGVAFEDVMNRALDSGLVLDAEDNRDGWLAERMARHSKPEGSFIQRRKDGCWIEVTEQKTSDGGTVAIYADITQQREAEIELRDAKDRAEQASELVSQKNAMLESLSTKLSKYLSPQVYSSIFRGEQNVEIASRRRKLTIMFAANAGFTETADMLDS